MMLFLKEFTKAEIYFLVSALALASSCSAAGKLVLALSLSVAKDVSVELLASGGRMTSWIVC